MYSPNRLFKNKADCVTLALNNQKEGTDLNRLSVHKGLTLFFALVLLLAGCSSGGPEEATSPNDSTQQAQSSNDVTDLNWKVPEFNFTNQDGKEVGLKDLQGKVWLASFIFTRCPDVCPPMTANKSKVQQELQQKGIDIQYVSFSVDPDFDKPEQLKEFGERHQADFSQWHFLTGYSVEEIQKIAKEAFKGSIDQQKGPSEKVPILINHPTQFYLIDGNGQVRKFYSGLESDTKKLAEQIAKDVQEIQ